MSFATIGLVALLTSTVLWMSRAVLVRELRWKFYALRDELRDLAYLDRSHLENPVFWKLDRSLTLFCRHLETLSIWTLLPIWLFRKSDPPRGRHIPQKRLERTPDASLKAIYFRSLHLLLAQLLLRHWIALPLFLFGWLAWVAARGPVDRLIARILGGVFVNPPIGDLFDTREHSPTIA